MYGVGGGALQIVGLLTLPIYARVFVPAQYGVLEIATIGFAALLVLVDSGMTSAALRSFYDYSDEQEAERRAALFTSLAVMMSLSLAVGATTALLAGSISSALFGTPAHADLVWIVGWTVPVATLAAYMRELLRLRFRAWHYVVSALLGAIGAAATGVLAVTVFGAGIFGVLLGLLVGNALAALYGVAVAGGDLVGRFSTHELRRMARYGGPLIPAAFAMWGLAFLDRVMLSQLGGFSQTGQYGVGSRYAMVLMFCVSTFMTAYNPFQLSLWQEDPETERQVRARLLSYVTLALVAMGLVMALFARELTAILAPRYDRAYLVVGVLFDRRSSLRDRQHRVLLHRPDAPNRLHRRLHGCGHAPQRRAKPAADPRMGHHRRRDRDRLRVRPARAPVLPQGPAALPHAIPDPPRAGGAADRLPAYGDRSAADRARGAGGGRQAPGDGDLRPGRMAPAADRRGGVPRAPLPGAAAALPREDAKARGPVELMPGRAASRLPVVRRTRVRDTTCASEDPILC